jgi:AraC-like DNA-binding protein
MSARLLASYITGFPIPTQALVRPKHRHAHHEIVYSLRGSGISTAADGQVLRFGTGDVCIYPAFMYHDRHFATPGSSLVIRLRVESPTPLALRRALLVRAPLQRWVRSEISALAHAQSPVTGFARLALDFRCSAMLCGLLAAAEPDRSIDPEALLVDQAAQLIAERFARIGRLEEIASHLGIGYDRLRRAFRRQRGQSLVAWLTAVRIRRAQELLANSTLGHDEIARQCGYGNSRYLNRVFHRLVGTTPGRWRHRSALVPSHI